jgi:hypothetical protein
MFAIRTYRFPLALHLTPKWWTAKSLAFPHGKICSTSWMGDEEWERGG